MTRRAFTILAAVLLVFAGLLFVFTETVEAAWVGLGFVFAGGLCLLFGRFRPAK